MNYFLIVYDRRRGEQVEPIRSYNNRRRQQALHDRFQLDRKYRGRSDIEVVVLGAASEDALRATHSRYFKTTSELTEAV